LKVLLSPEDKSKILVKELALSALLYIEFQQLDAKVRLSSQKKNDLLQIWLNKQSKNSRYRRLKKKLKTLLNQFKKTQVDLETIFTELANYQADSLPTHLEEYLLLIRRMERNLGLTVMLSSAQELDLDYSEIFIAVLSNDLNSHFSNAGKLLLPIEFLARLPTAKRSSFLEGVFSSPIFTYRILYEDDKYIRIEFYVK